MIHTPYDGSSPLFRIGVRPLDPADWIEVDGRLADYLGEKERLAAGHPDEVFAAEPGTEAAQAELLAMLVAYLPVRYPEIYRQQGETLKIVPAGQSVALDAGLPPLRIAASLVQDDLVLMRRGESGWRLAAASLSFPSSWRLLDKFGLPLHEVHAPVPGFGAGTRNSDVIARMFDHVRPETPVIRWNWSIYGDDALAHAEPGQPRGLGERVFLRVERQTLRKLPVSGDIAFGIHVYVDALEAVVGRPGLAAALAEQLMGLSAEELAYKGMTGERERLVARLRAQL